jgi:hypothetical protein
VSGDVEKPGAGRWMILTQTISFCVNPFIHGSAATVYSSFNGRIQQGEAVTHDWITVAYESTPRTRVQMGKSTRRNAGGRGGDGRVPFPHRACAARSVPRAHPSLLRGFHIDAVLLALGTGP